MTGNAYEDTWPWKAKTFLECYINWINKGCSIGCFMEGVLECKVTCKGDLEWRYVDTTYE
jgi:hypothetical protein